LTGSAELGKDSGMPRAKVKRAVPWDQTLSAVEKLDNGLVLYNVLVSGRRTSMRLDAVTWSLLGETARREGLAIHELCTRIEKEKPRRLSLTVSIRRYLLRYFRNAATESGDAKAGRRCGFCRH
jgi:predicted DNA-binding ribbon-helix-helix protein